MKTLALLWVLAFSPVQLVEVNQAKIENLEEDFVYVREDLREAREERQEIKDAQTEMAVQLGIVNDRTALILEILKWTGIIGGGGTAGVGGRIAYKKKVWERFGNGNGRSEPT